jgi:uncharacterized membrane protein/glutaredoxin
MSRKSKTRAMRAAAPVVTRSGPNWPLLALSSLGVILTGYLTFTAFTGAAVQGCAVGGGCDTVLTSRWATLLGLPTSLWGLIGYVALAALAFVRRADTQWSYAWTIAFFGLCYSVYLTVISLTQLQSACPYCLTSFALMAAIFGLVTWQRPSALGPLSWGWAIGPRAALAAIVILMLHANYVAPAPEPIGPEDPTVRALAEHLAENDVVFYGASWCPHCQQQKALFGASAARLPYVECSLGGPSAPQAAACRNAGVRSYPTWVIDGRAYVGEVLTLAQLADASGFPGSANLR